jgi:putative spermidine/putrescine transport system substrate-binding protein
MTRHTFLKTFLPCALGAAVAIFAVVPGIHRAAAADHTLTVVGWGGSFQDAQREAIWKPFEKATGIVIKEDTWNGNFGKVKAMVESKSVTWDVVWGDYAHAVAGCEAGILVPIIDLVDDPKDFLPGIHHECGISDSLFSTLAAYDGDKIPAAWNGQVPTTAAEALDVQKFPGKRGLRKIVKGLFEFTLMATGVPADKVYDVLATDEGVQRVLNKFESMKGSIVWYTSSAQGLQLLADGEVSVSYTYAGRVFIANQKEKRNLKLIWDGQVYSTNTIFVPKGANVEDARKLIKFALQPKVSADFSNLSAYGPARKSAVPLVNEDVRKALPNYPPNLKNALLRNEQFWADQEQRINEKFTAWLAKQ